MGGSQALRLAALICAGVVVGGAMLACPSTDRLSSGGEETGDTGGLDGGPDAASDDAGCLMAHPPAAPIGVTDGPDLPPIVLATRAFATRLSPDAGLLGYDLDDACTCLGEVPDAATPCATQTSMCDDADGRDVTATKMLGLVPGADPIGATNAFIAAGLGTTLFVLEGYNGTPDDPSIFWTSYLSNGSWATTPDGGAYLDDGGLLDDGGPASPVAPAWDGTDRWALNAISAPGGTPTVRVPGWVAGGILVAHAQRIPGFLVPVGFGAGIDLTEAIITGRIARTEGRYELVDAQLVGRALASQILGAVRTSRSVTDAGVVKCKVSEPTVYPLVKGAVCAGRDVMQFRGAEGTGQACDSLAQAIAFTAVEAHIGPTRAGTTPCPIEEDQCP